MNSLVILISGATLILLLAFAVRLRDWIRGMRSDIYIIRDEVRAIKRTSEEMGTTISSMAAESVNATCINTLGFRFPVFL